MSKRSEFNKDKKEKIRKIYEDLEKGIVLFGNDEKRAREVLKTGEDIKALVKEYQKKCEEPERLYNENKKLFYSIIIKRLEIPENMELIFVEKDNKIVLTIKGNEQNIVPEVEATVEKTEEEEKRWN